MKKTILIIVGMIFLVSLVSAAKEPVFVINLNYNYGKVSLRNLIVAQGYFNPPINQPDDAYHLEIISCSGEELYSEGFEFNLELVGEPLAEWFDDFGNQIYFPKTEESGITLSKSTKELLVPYFNDTLEINIYDANENLILNINQNFDTICYDIVRFNMRFYFLVVLVVLLLIFGVIVLINKTKKKV